MVALPCPVALNARYRPAAPAVTSTNQTSTYADLERCIRRAQQVLQTNPELEGRYIGMLPRRTVSTVAWLWACWREGRCVVPVSRRWTPEERADALAMVGARGCLAETGDALPETASCTVHPIALEPRPDASRAWRSTSPRTIPVQAMQGDATVIFTSGSTGRPKGVVHTWRAHLYSARGAARALPLRATDCWALSLPLYHIGGLAIVIRAALAGASVAILDDPVRDWAVRRITHGSLVATQLKRVLGAIDGGPPRALRGLLIGGGPVPEALLDEAYARGWPVHTTYGSTEMASQVTTTPPGASRETLATAGQVLPYRELKISDIGEICVRGATRCRAYLTPEGRTQPFDAQGWLGTGDIGHIDEAERLYVTGRVDHQFISGGENIQPETVERALEALPQVARAVVVSVPDDEFGRRPVAFVEPAPGTAFAPGCYRSGLQGRLARFKHPDRYLLWPNDLPGSMKVDRSALQVRALRQT
ncbi:MAG: o-succinylbenzoate--CoA ligase [Longimonas sp.]|uniref:o-succinylbenzoate--CoA ligase n=1 Tax=Longimonas sp. TaxID=2039626 RepID=UPI003355A0DD